MSCITDIEGVSVGHSSDFKAGTGCTVVLFDTPVFGAVELNGGGTSTRQIDSLLPHGTYGRINAILLTGGSTYGLSATDGVLKYLEERSVGLQTKGGIVIPSVPSAVIYDLGVGDGKIRPDLNMGYGACLNAARGKIEEGCVGVGTGATIGKISGVDNATKGGIASACFNFPNGIMVGVLVVVNAFGDVYSLNKNEIIAGARSNTPGEKFLNTTELIKSGFVKPYEPYSSTTLCIVATNAQLNKHELMRISKITHTGISRVIHPVNTVSDGDIVFTVSVGEEKGDANSIGIAASDLISDTIIDAVHKARGMFGIPSHNDLK